MAYTPDNNPYIPGDPYSYDLKWVVDEINTWKLAEEGLDQVTNEANRAKEEADRAEEKAGDAAISASDAADSATNAYNSEMAAKNYADNIADPVSGLVTEWMNDNITQPTTPIVDTSLSISGAAADAQVTGEYAKLPCSFDPVILAPSLISGTNYSLFDNAYSSVLSRQNATKRLYTPAFSVPVPTMLCAALYLVGDYKTIDPLDIKPTYRYGVNIKLVNEGVPTKINIHSSSAPGAWSGSYLVSTSKVITVRQSGLYIIDSVPYVGSSPLSYKLEWVGIEYGAVGFGNIEYVEFYNDPPVTLPSRENENSYDMIFWGDSLTAGAGGGGTTYPDVCASILGKSYINCGVGGESANTVSCRQGGNNLVVPAGSINGTYPESNFVDVFGGDVRPLLQGDGSGTGNKIYIDGQQCNLGYSAGNYTISGYTGGSSSIPKLATFVGADVTGDTTVIWVGENGSSLYGNTDVNARIAIIKSMISKLNNEHYIVIGLSSGTEALRAADDSAMAAAFGNKFFPVRKLLVDYGLTIAGITPTAQDMSDIALGIVPTSLRSDSVHLNADGYTAVGVLLADKFVSLKY